MDRTGFVRAVDDGARHLGITAHGIGALGSNGTRATDSGETTTTTHREAGCT